MTEKLPQRSRNYDSDTSASGVWTRFKTRPDDIFVCTPPKCGTTWMQSICGMLIFQDPQVNPGIGTISAWLDSKFNEESELVARLNAQTHRRYIKTHTPLDGIIYDPQCTYVTVYRHPLDVAFSAQNHLKNMKSDGLNHLIIDDMNDGIQGWIEKVFSPDQNIGESLESLVVHYRSFDDWHAAPNIHFFHYEDMKKDLVGAVARLADIFGYDFDAPLIEAVANAATFSNMKENALKYAPSAEKGIWKESAQFFESGTSKKWDGVLSDEVVDMYNARMNGLLGASDRSWLEYGSMK